MSLTAQQTKIYRIGINTFVDEIFEKDASTMQHSHDVYDLVNIIYRQLPKSLKTEVNRQNLFDAALLHDVGKIAVPDIILNKPSSLNTSEMEIVRSHAAKGKIMLAVTRFKEVADIVCFHHERVDGNGYFHLPREQIPLESRIIAVADTYSALTTDRVYRKKCSKDNAIRVLIEVSGTQLDERFVEIICRSA